MTKRKKSSAPRTREPKANQDAASTKAPSAEDSATNQASAPESTKSPQSAEVPLATGSVADSEATIVSAPEAIGATPGDDDAPSAAPGDDDAIGEAAHSEDEAIGEPAPGDDDGLEDTETTVNLVGELPLPGRDDLDAPTARVAGEALEDVDGLIVQRAHLRGLLEALIFASDTPIKPNELAKLASAPVKQVRELLGELRHEYSARGVHLEEVAGGWVFRTSAQYAPFIRDLTKQKPVRLTRAQVETLAIIAYRQPITRPEVDDVRGVDSGPVLKVLLERDLVRILGKRDEPGRPLIYGTTTHFLEFFGLKSLKDLPTLREFTELTEESRATYEDELGEPPNITGPAAASPTDDEGQPSRDSMSVPKGTHEHDEHDEHDAPEHGEAERHDDEAHEPGPVEDPLDDEALARDDGPTIASDAFAPPPSEEEEKPPPSSPDERDATDDERDATDDERDATDDERD